MKITNYVADWLDRADEDIETAHILTQERGPANPICFHAQQASEKFLKAFLAHNGQNIRKIHDLEALVDLCEKIDSEFGELRTDAAYLIQFYVGSRYPGDYPEFTLEECQKALEAAKRVVDLASPSGCMDRF